MSNYVYPDLPLIDVHVDRERIDNTSIYESPSGAEQRVSWYTVPRYRYRVHYPALRDYTAAPAPWTPYSELGVVLWFLDQHRGPGQSFLFNDLRVKKNLLSYSQDLSQSAWVKTTEPGTSVTADVVAAPDGTTTADRIDYVGGGTAGGVRVKQAFAVPSVNGQQYAGAWWLKANTGATNLQISLNVASVVIALTSSWQRFTVTGTGDGVANGQMMLLSAAGDNSLFSIYAWGAQVEPASSASLYVPTGASPITGQVRVRFEEDTLRLRRVVNDIWEAEFSLISVAA